ncbi:MAG TPA: hypothetical protein VM142_09545 [Acidimicrobiales bacterium]|nr:hypothetical protein [Acidimicrobiales bacterium]
MTAPESPPPPAASPAASGRSAPGTALRSGRRIVQGSWAGTLVFAASSGLATVASSTDLIALIVALGMFVGGIAGFTAAFVLAVRRSRTEEIVVPSLFFLQGSAPTPVKRLLLGSLAAEVVVAFVTAGIRPNTSLAFGILAPMYGLGLIGLWAARHGTFPRRPPPADGRRRAPSRPGTGPGYHRPSESD